MRTAFLLGFCFSAGFCIPAAALCLCVAITADARGRAAVRHRQRVIRDAVTELGQEDIMAMLRGDADGREEDADRRSPPHSRSLSRPLLPVCCVPGEPVRHVDPAAFGVMLACLLLGQILAYETALVSVVFAACMAGMEPWRVHRRLAREFAGGSTAPPTSWTGSGMHPGHISGVPFADRSRMPGDLSSNRGATRHSERTRKEETPCFH